MDCKTARQLLPFARPRAAELEAPAAEARERPRGECRECEALARAGQRLDEPLGRAVRRLEVPPLLRDQLLARLEAERGAWYRRRYGHGIRLLAAAAAVLLLF